MLKQRIMTAILLALIFIGTVLFASYDWVRLMFAVMLGVGLFELSNLTLKPGVVGSVVLGLLAGLALWWFGSDFAALAIKYLVTVGVLLWVGIAFWLPAYRCSGHQSIFSRLIYFFLGLFFLALCAVTLVFIHGYFEHGGWVLLYLMTLVWLADIGAYFSGRRFGKNKLAADISPGKTREGVIGGLLATIIWMLLVYFVTDLLDMGLLWFIAIGLATSVISIVGDLFASILKREAGVKDSGSILPGHGGVLDRIDSVLAATPIFVAGLFLAGLV